MLSALSFAGVWGIMHVLLKNHSHLPDCGLIFPLALDLYITMYLTVFASDMMAILVSCIVKDNNSAMTVMPFILIVQLIMAGVVFDLEGIADRISNLTISKWGMNGLMSIAFTTESVRNDPYLFGLTKENPWQKADDLNLAKIWLIILCIAVVCIVLSMIALSFVDRDKR